jgi:UDP-glucose 4-epimerase
MNYAKYVEQGDVKLTTALHSEDYNSHNTERLDVAQMKALLMKLEFMQNIISGSGESKREYAGESTHYRG